jgi:hypothetical protein
MAFHIALHSDSSDIYRDYPEGIDLKGGYEVALKSFVAYNNIPNISPLLNNNVLTLVEHHRNDGDRQGKASNDADDRSILVTASDDDDQESYVAFTQQEKFTQQLQTQADEAIQPPPSLLVRNIVFDSGCYKLADIETTILKDVSHHEHNTIMMIDNVRMRVGIKSSWTLDMTQTNSIGPLLGFERKMYPPTDHYIYSTKPVQLFTVHNIRIKTNLTRCNIQDGDVRDATLYEFPLAAAATEKIIERPLDPEYYSVVPERIHFLRVSVLDQQNKLMDFRGEMISLLLHFRPSLY